MNRPMFCCCDSKTFLAFITIFSIFTYIMTISITSYLRGFDPKLASALFLILLDLLFLYGILRDDTALLRILYWFSTFHTITIFIILIIVPVAVTTAVNFPVHYSENPEFLNEVAREVFSATENEEEEDCNFKKIVKISQQLLMQDLEHQLENHNKAVFISGLVTGYATTSVIVVLFIVSYIKHSIIGDCLRYAEFLQNTPQPLRLMTY
ncbi:unnamed protein product [Caenorhabditis angaria]|uniref:Uncharacterized protein n=1 Tax=Caenorhabditis angaria TaxID=860376 RepID=A0A9P1IDW2_9PELO|nr:unnamed protein product [Caenorhabditis angaria]